MMRKGNAPESDGFPVFDARSEFESSNCSERITATAITLIPYRLHALVFAVVHL